VSVLHQRITRLLASDPSDLSTGVRASCSTTAAKAARLFLCVSVLLLALLLASGVLAVRFLSEVRTQELAATRALTERTREISGLWLSV
jgi:hypothetical protein